MIIKRLLYIMLILSLCHFCGVALAEEDAASLSIMIGTVEVRPHDTDVWMEATEGMMLFGGDKIRTGADGMVSILFSNGSLVSLKQDTTFEIESLNISQDKKDVDYKLQLTRGKLKAIVEELSDDSTFEIKTPTAVAAVRGTTYYLYVREVTEQELPPGVKERLATEIFVEEGGVLYTNLFSGSYFSISTGQTSSSLPDGTVSVPIDVPPDKLLEWLQGWDILDVEAYQEPGEGGDPDPGEGGGTENTGGDRQSDKLSALLLDAQDAYERELIWKEIVERLLELEELEEEYERQFLRSEIADILEDNMERRLEGYIEKISDAQMGKVLTDVHGNRVRIEQYVLRPAPDVVELLNVNLRGGEDLTTMEWATVFNKSLDDILTSGQLRTLPWDSYLATQYNVVGDIPIPAYIVSPAQPNDIYPEAMGVRLMHSGDFFVETREFSDRTIGDLGGIQGIRNMQLQVSNFNDGEFMIYDGPLLARGQFIVTDNVREATIGGADFNPEGFRYDFMDQYGQTGSIGAAFYVLSDTAGRQDGYASLSIRDIWSALGVNMIPGMMSIGDNNLEMVFTSEEIFADPIDLIYIPFQSMEWEGNTIPDYSLTGESTTPPALLLD
jgi:hypothetical protein